ncbi:MAG: AAA family ATPase [Bacteroidales bacterium]|nr:AAA family ATPase [Bacteroidales bacterium]
MRFRGFKINNYRSIVDSGWNFLAYDNITALIGQNESGKTSVLEALMSYYDGKISDDVLRSDMTFPVVCCMFELNDKNISQLIDTSRISEELRDIINNKKEIILQREWKPDRTSSVTVGDDDVRDYYLKIQQAKEELEKLVQKEINDLLSKADKVLDEMELAEREKQEARNDLNQWYLKLEEAKKSLKKARKHDARLIAEQELDTVQQLYGQSEEQFNSKVKLFEEKKLITQELSEKVTVCKRCTEAIEKVKAAAQDLESLSKQLREAEHLYDIYSNEKEKKTAQQKLEKCRMDLARIQKIHNDAIEHEKIQKATAARVFNGQNFRIAETEAIAELKNEKRYLTPEDIGNQIFEHIPQFDFFEDFSSLLPNKIDLEDLLSANVHAEGYKAAQNFLLIAGLNSDFFREKNHRILKQKIENLNSEIAIDFQDYWRQNVGKDNKIRLNFELEHYDYSVPEKSGKPYLEFWIKDKQERLYPKQRSRGVRWFLSFYLELKATALQNSQNRVLLIDEPGLSLHARAQEDVLKVFEDLKDAMQIIYCTHSPHLVDVNKLYRILAVQRADENDENSETVILDAKSLPLASSDTLSPIYSLMGARLNEQQYIKQKNNLIVQDTIVYYYLNVMSKLLDIRFDVHYIPATGTEGIRILANVLTGWKLDFSILLFGNGENREFAETIKKQLFIGKEAEADKRINILETYAMIEDLFSTIDFKRFILQKRVGITEANSEYILTNELSRTLLAASFLTYVQDNRMKLADFDEETRNNFKKLFGTIEKMIA